MHLSTVLRVVAAAAAADAAAAEVTEFLEL